MGIPGERAVQEPVARQLARQIAVFGAAHLPRLQVAGLGGGDLFGREAVLERARDLFLECRFDPAGVLRRADRGGPEGAQPVE